MKNHRRGNLKALLQAQEPPVPPPGFTDGVMREVGEMTREQMIAGSPLAILLQRSGPPEAPADFTAEVIDGIKQKGYLPQAKPVIGASIWMAAAVFVIVCVFVGFYPASSHIVTPDPYTAVGAGIAKVMSRHQTFLLYMVIAGSVALVLLAIELLMKKKWTTGADAGA